jgi:PAS domain S-box-containing protein
VWKAISQFVTVPTPAIAPANYRTYVTFNVGAISAFLVHLCTLPLFWWLGAVEMLWLNVLSELAYLGALWANRRGHHAAMLTTCAVELWVHQTACVHYLGWAAGFQYYLLVLPAFIFSLPRGRSAVQVFLLACSTAVFVGLLDWSLTVIPVHAVDTRVLALVADANVAVVFGLLGFFGFNYRSAAEAAEERLALTERRLAEQRLALLRAAVSAAQDVIVITDEQGRVEFANDAFGTVTGHAPSDVIGHGMALLKSGVHPPAFYQDMWRTLASGQTWTGRMVNRRRDGTFYSDDTRITPVTDDAGKKHYIAIKQDVTEAVRAEEKLQKTEDQLRQAKKMEAIGTLAGGVAHDFNNLLTAILGSAYCLLQELPGDDPHREDILEIKKAGERAAMLTRQLLAYSRKQVLLPRVLDTNQVLHDMEKLLRRSVSEQVALVLDLAPGVRRIEADESQLGQVLLNLAVNANDAMPRGGTLTVKTANASLAEATRVGQFTVPAGEYVVIAVGDTGHGMEAALVGQIFEPFFTTKAPGRGTGLGLSTVYGIVTQSGGYVTVESTPGQGTTFKVFLLHTTAVLPPPEVAEHHAPSLSSETVLCVDDDVSVRQVTTRMLQSAGYHVLEAGSAQEALELLRLRAATVHLILTDVMMPGVDGPTLVERVRISHPDVCAVYLSGYPCDVIARHGEFVTGENFLSKPYAPAALAAIVRKALEARPSPPAGKALAPPHVLQ